MKKSWLSTGAVAAASLMLLAACGSSTSSSSSAESAPAGSEAPASAPASSGGEAQTAKRACVILPDAASSPRWENGDRPALEKALTDAGFEVDIQNAQGDVAKYATIGDQQLTQGCGAMILVDYQGAAIGVMTKAQAQGVPVIAYDRPIEGADYYVSFDGVAVGELQGQCILDGLAATGKDPKTAKVVYVGGDASDGNAKLFHDGAVSVMEPAGIKPAFETPGTWDAAKAQTGFEQAYTALQGNIDAVWSANDTNAASVIAVLDKNGKTIPVSGQDATVTGLQNVLLGKQFCTVYKPYDKEAEVASKLVIDVLSGATITPPATFGPSNQPYFTVDSVVVGPEQVKDVVADGAAAAADICTADVADACAKYGVS